MATTRLLGITAITCIIITIVRSTTVVKRIIIAITYFVTATHHIRIIIISMTMVYKVHRHFGLRKRFGINCPFIGQFGRCFHRLTNWNQAGTILVLYFIIIGRYR